MTDLVYAETDGIAWITLNRPDKVNALSSPLRAEIYQALVRADADPVVKVVVLRGAGQRGFCAGADISEFQTPSNTEESEAARSRFAWIEYLGFEMQKPVICGIHGYCLGGGLETALACDIRVATADATLGLTEIRWGVIPGAGGTQRLARLAGPGTASRMVLTGATVSGSEAKSLGIVEMVCEPPELERTLEDLAKRIATHDTIALTYAKQALRQSQDGSLRTGLAFERRLAQLLTFSEARHRGATRFTGRNDHSASG